MSLPVKNIDLLLSNVYKNIFTSDEEFFVAFDKYFREIDQSKLPPDAKTPNPLLHELFRQVATSKKNVSDPRSSFENKVLYVLKHKYYANLYYKSNYLDMHRNTAEQRLKNCTKHLTDFADFYDQILKLVPNRPNLLEKIKKIWLS